MTKPIPGILVIEGSHESRRFLWRIFVNNKYLIEPMRSPFKREATARNDAIRIAKRLNLKLVETI